MAHKELADTLNALEWCMTHTEPTMCAICPYGDLCVGDNTPLMEDAKEAILEMAQMAASGTVQQLLFSDFIQAGGVTCWIIKQDARRGRTKWRVTTGTFRPTDLDKLGKTVFLREGDAFRKIRRLQNGHK